MFLLISGATNQPKSMSTVEEVNKIEQEWMEVRWINTKPNRSIHCFLKQAINAKLCVESYAKSSDIGTKLCVKSYANIASDVPCLLNLKKYVCA